MNKTALRNFATKARIELLERVELQALKIGISKDGIDQASIESSDAIILNGKPLEETERKQRDKLIHRIEEIGYDRVMEETAYTWFNRFVALRFMEVNNYLPTRVRVLSSDSPDSTEPDMMREALELNLDIDKQYIYDLKMANKQDELFKYLIQLHCNDLNKYMPFMFETLEDYMMILFPEGLLGTDSFVKEMTDLEVISEEDWGKVEIIGWLYQYYIAEENRRVIQAKKQYKVEELPVATQLFTPEWIVKYMVQNSLGRYWIESNPNQANLSDNWEYYLKNREENYEEKIKEYMIDGLNIEKITCFDPAMGSGHILVYMFDVLYEIYSENGYREREIPRLILEKNLYGLDIDRRAYQLASFSVVMKALQYNRRFLRSIERDGLRLNLAVIEETNEATQDGIAFLAGEEAGTNFDKMNAFIKEFEDGKSIGSLLKITTFDEEFIKERLQAIEKQADDLFILQLKERTVPLLKNLLKQSQIMTRKHDIFVTNPPYAGNRYIPANVKKYLNKNYNDVKSDLFSAFIEYSFSATKENGQIGFMTPYVWMFISSYEKLRDKIINDRTISNLVQLEYSGFDGATVPICTFTLRNYPSNIAGEYIRLEEFRGAVNQPIKTREAVENPDVTYRYTFEQEQFGKIPGSPIAYWTNNNHYRTYENAYLLKEISEVRKGLTTGNTDKFIKYWYEVDIKNTSIIYNDIKKPKWYPCHKGGDYRKWYGNFEKIINWQNDGYEIKNYKDDRGKLRSRPQNLDFMFRKGIVFSKITSAGSSCRLMTGNEMFDDAVQGIFINDKYVNTEYLLALLNSPIIGGYLKILNPTLNKQINDLERIPVLIPSNYNEIIEKLEPLMKLYKTDWGSFETSWDFENHPLLVHKADTLEVSFNQWSNFAEDQFNQLKTNEEKLNEIFIEIYDLEDELTPDVEEKDVTVRKADLERDVKSFISYAVGCSFGRYSLDEEGLIYAGGDFDASRYNTFPADDDNIIPVLDAAYFEDDIVNRFIQFVQVTYGEATLDENLQFVAEAIGKRASETAREAIRRYFMNNFYKDHTQTYKKHPIYWLFSSGKEKAFNCLIYMHRYDKTTLSRIRTDYLHDVQTRYETRRLDLIALIDAGDAIAKDKRELKDIEKKIEELKQYDEKLHHMADMQIEIDLDDGVKENYKKFDGLLAKI